MHTPSNVLFFFQMLCSWILKHMKEIKDCPTGCILYSYMYNAEMENELPL
jgi:hypothetical protein